MTTVQIVCPACKNLTVVDDKQLVTHYNGDVVCSNSGMKYIPSHRLRASSAPEDISEMMSHMPKMPDGAELVAATAIKCEAGHVHGGVAVISVPEGTPPPEEFFKTKTAADAVTTRTLENMPVPVGKHGAN